MKDKPLENPEIRKTFQYVKQNVPTIKQLHSSISFVFRLWDSERKTSYVLKVFTQKLYS